MVSRYSLPPSTHASLVYAARAGAREHLTAGSVLLSSPNPRRPPAMVPAKIPDTRPRASLDDVHANGKLAHRERVPEPHAAVAYLVLLPGYVLTGLEPGAHPGRRAEELKPQRPTSLLVVSG